MIAAYVGMPGDCKTYSLTHWLIKEMLSGRTGVSQYAVHGAERLMMIGDLFHDHFRGASVAIDEIARILPARDWSNDDEVESALLETHRHLGLEIRYACQHRDQVSKQLRDLTEWWIFCFRCGPDPSRLLKLGIRPKWWQVPIAVRQEWIHRNDMSSDGTPKAPERRFESKTKYIMWRRNIALAYDTTERLYPGLLQKHLEDQMGEASERIFTVPPWEVAEGKSISEKSQIFTSLNRGRDDKAARRERVNRRANTAGGGTDAKLQEAARFVLQSGKKGTGDATAGKVGGTESNP